MPHSFLLILFLLVFLFLATNSIWQSMAQADAGELNTLLTIKQGWGSPSSLSSWTAQNTSYCTTWTGVGCSSGKVSALSFQGLNITHPVPPSICSLNNLSRLDLSYNHLTDRFPTALYSCVALQYLDLSNNLFSGALPADIGKLSPAAMEHLNLSSNRFAGAVPAAIAGLPKLKSLLLDNNRFRGTYPASAIAGRSELETLTLAYNPFAPGPIPDGFGELTKLKTLWLSGMNLTGGIPDALSSLTELTTLALSDNKLGGEIPAWVWKLQKLEFLYLNSNSFAGAIGSGNITAVSMREVDLSTNRLTGPIADSVGSMKNLTLLYLYFNNITGEIPACVGLLPNLADIRLFNNMLTGRLPPELGRHSPLGNLEVSNNRLSGELPATLCYNKKLYDIVVFNNSISSDFPAVIGVCHTVNNIMAYNNRFTGEFPVEVWSTFPALTTVMIQNNSFTGTLPSVISPNITMIQMGNNRFSGALPAAAPGLKTFTAENNLFSGGLPADMSGFASLIDLDISGNMISGSIPPSVGSLIRVNSLNLSSNQMSGAIPPEIGLLPGLTILDLSDNRLSGEIPPEFKNLHLVSLNLSSNQLTGEVPESLQNAAFAESFLRNPGLCATVDTDLNIPACRCPGKHNQMSTGLTILFSVVAGVVLMGTVWCFIIRRTKRGQDLTTWRMTPFHKDFSECDVLTQLREENVIGSGGSGKVYRVRVRGCGGAVVAVKKLWSRGKAEEKLDKEFDSQVEILGAIRHANIVSLLCYISKDDTKLLVYEYMENGNLDRWWLHPKDPAMAPLGWPTRLCIAIDAARGLIYMHKECAQPIMHRDIKSISNILLDPSFQAKIADFGLTRILVKSGEPESVSAVDRSLHQYNIQNGSAHDLQVQPEIAHGAAITAQQKKRLHDLSRKSSSFVFTVIASYMISSSEPLYSTGHIPCLVTLGLFIAVELALSKETMTLQLASNLVTLSGSLQLILTYIMLVSFNEYYGLAALFVPLLLIAVAIEQAYKHVGGTNDGSDKQQLESDAVFDSIFDFASDTVNLGGFAAMFSGRYMAGPATIVGFVVFFTLILGIYLMTITVVRTPALTPHAKYLIHLLKALRWVTVITAMIHVGCSSGGD